MKFPTFLILVISLSLLTFFIGLGCSFDPPNSSSGFGSGSGSGSEIGYQKKTHWRNLPQWYVLVPLLVGVYVLSRRVRFLASATSRLVMPTMFLIISVPGCRAGLGNFYMGDLAPIYIILTGNIAFLTVLTVFKVDTRKIGLFVVLAFLVVCYQCRGGVGNGLIPPYVDSWLIAIAVAGIIFLILTVQMIQNRRNRRQHAVL